MTIGRDATGSDAGGLPPAERTRRFWNAHGRSLEHLTALYAAGRSPELDWTPEHLVVWYGLRIDRARSVAEELAECGIARRTDHGSYRWNRELDWTLAPDGTGLRSLQERWVALVKARSDDARGDRGGGRRATEGPILEAATSRY